MAAWIHPSAVVDPQAELGSDVQVGPFCYVGPNVRLGDGCVLRHHACVDGHSSLGPRNELFPFCVLGMPPQDLKYKGEPSRLEVGEANVFREHVTVHIGTAVGGAVTRVGNHNLLMNSAHVAHDCVLHDRNIVAAGVLLAGHIHVGPNAIVGGGTMVQQFATVGRSCYIGGGVRLRKDAPPYCKVDHDPARAWDVNAEGMRRQGFDHAQISQVKDVFKALFVNRAGTPIAEVVAQLTSQAHLAGPAAELLAFVRDRLGSPTGRLLEHARTDQAEDRTRFYRESAS